MMGRGTFFIWFEIMATEKVTLTLRGQDYSYDIDSQAVDIMLLAFMEQFTPEDPKMSQEEHFAKRLRRHAEEVTGAYAAEKDRGVTPNMDAVKPFISGT